MAAQPYGLHAYFYDMLTMIWRHAYFYDMLIILMQNSTVIVPQAKVVFGHAHFCGILVLWLHAYFYGMLTIIGLLALCQHAYCFDTPIKIWRLTW